MFSLRNVCALVAKANRARCLVSSTSRHYHSKGEYNGQGKSSKGKWFPSWFTNGLVLSLPVIPTAYALSGAFEDEEKGALRAFNMSAFNILCLTAGDPLSTHSKVLDTAADVIQRKRPVDSIGLHLCAIHFYSGDLQRQLIAHHYCTHLTQDVHQCIIYDTDKPDARIIGVEYIISEKLYKTLPPEEKKLWHSHMYEVKSGQLTMPGVPPFAEHVAVTDIVNTYGKTWHFWQVDRGDTLPLGIPQLMMALTEDGQIASDKAEELNKQTLVTNIESRRAARVDIKAHPVDKGANAWEKGEVFQLELKKLGK